MNQKLFFIVPLLAILAACDSKTGKIDAFSKYPPDEFAVSVKKPLVIPPDFTLRPPSDIANPKDSQTAVAKQTIFGAGSNASNEKSKQALLSQGLTAGETRFLELANALNPNDKIKELLVADNANLENDKTLADVLFFWRSPSKAGLLSPDEEQKRVQRNITLGESLKNGKVIKQVDDGRTTLFDKIPAN